jgi:hypothetical protein
LGLINRTNNRFRTARTSKYFDLVDEQRLNIRTLNFNHGHLMAVNGENKAGVARDGDKAEPVTVVTVCQKSQTQIDRPRTDRWP